MNDGFGGAMCDRVNVLVMLANQPPRPGVLLRRRDKLPCQSAGPYADRKWQFIPSFAERDYVIS